MYNSIGSEVLLIRPLLIRSECISDGLYIQWNCICGGIAYPFTASLLAWSNKPAHKVQNSMDMNLYFLCNGFPIQIHLISLTISTYQENIDLLQRVESLRQELEGEKLKCNTQ